MQLPEQLKELRDEKIWVNYLMIWNQSKHGGEGGYDKPPVNPHTLRDGSSTDPKRWATFDQANAQIGKAATVFYKNKECVTQPIAGVGLVLEPAGILGIDMDDVLRRQDGKLLVSAEAKKIWQYVNSYTEVSVSGTGIHILVFGKKPGDAVCKVKNLDGTEYEIYDSGRYFTLSGMTLQGSGCISRRDEEVKKIYDFILSRRSSSSPSVVSCGGTGERVQPSESDSTLWTKMFDSARGAEIRRLYDGDTSGHMDDHSRADLALCTHLAYWTNNDEARIDAMFRQSGLMRPKWNRDDYRTYTISRALTNRPIYREYSKSEKYAYAKRKEAEERGGRKNI